MKNNPTAVLFRTFKTGEVIALFPYIPASVAAPHHCLSYMHTGQHGAAAVEITRSRDTRPSTYQEIAPLLRELHAIGYDSLRILKRIPSCATQKRINAMNP